MAFDRVCFIINGLHKFFKLEWGQYNMQKSKIKNYENLGNAVCKALNSHGFKARYTATRGAALEAIKELIPAGATVGVAGSVSVREIGAIETLEEKGCKLIHHWKPNLTAEERKQTLLGEFCADWYLTGCNAVTKDGTLVSIDGTGNRVAVMSWSPGKIIYVIGINKITGTVDSAIERARNIASPPNAIRTGAVTPCVSLGYCTDCNSPGRICNVFTVIARCPLGREAHVIIVGEELGY